jgi:hypothetical protein
MPDRTRGRRRAGLVAMLCAGVVALGTIGSLSPVVPASAATTTVHGHVRSGVAPLASFEVTILQAGPDGGAPMAIGATTSAADGSFDVAVEAPTDPDAVLYALAVGPGVDPHAGAVKLAGVLGVGSLPADVVINERTTVASAFALTQFTHGDAIAGPSPGLQNAAGMAGNLVDVTTGELGTVLASSPNGADTSTRNTFNSLANMIASCVGTAANCAPLFALATPAGGPAPVDTFEALVDINRNPSNNAPDLFTFAPLLPYTPPRATAPDAWTLALRFVGDGVSMDGPGNMAVDTNGNIWVTNNYEFAPDAISPVCGGKQLLAFSPTGEYLEGSPFSGGGLDGAGFGIDIDPFGDVWVGNYGFAAPEELPSSLPGCPADQQPGHDTVSQFHSDGTAVSPPEGFSAGNITWPQGTKSDRDGNIWIANCQSDSVTVYPGGDPSRAREITDVGLQKPFDISHNNDGDAFVTGVQSSNVVMLQPDGTPTPGSPITGGGINRPLGITADSAGNQWVANSGLLDLPCPDFGDTGSVGGSVTLITADGELGSPAPFTGGGLTLPWDVAVDGNDNVWVANFAGKRLSLFCGLRPSTCPSGMSTGDAISPDTGYGFDGLVRNTGVVVDPSGNVWVANNWKEVPLQANPGGYEMVAFVGVAGPVHRAAPVPRPSRIITVVPRFTG